MIEHFGPVIEKIVETAGVEATKQALTKMFKKLSKKSDKKLAAEEETLLRKEVDALIRLATFDEVKEFDPKYRAITRTVKKVAKRSAAKKTPARKAIWRATKKAPGKTYATKKAPSKKPPSR